VEVGGALGVGAGLTPGLGAAVGVGTGVAPGLGAGVGVAPPIGGGVPPASSPPEPPQAASAAAMSSAANVSDVDLTKVMAVFSFPGTAFTLFIALANVMRALQFGSVEQSVHPTNGGRLLRRLWNVENSQIGMRSFKFPYAERNIHGPFGAKMAQKAHEYCVVSAEF
jgi:hypothetical protein